MTKKSKQTIKTSGYWLVKSEPSTYSIDDFRTEKKTLWTGVRNYQARNFMMAAMKPGDSILFYHSNANPSAVVGLGKVRQTNLPDPTAWDKKSSYHDPKSSPDLPIWFCAELAYVAHLKTNVSLPQLRAHSSLKDMALLKRGQRLSILPLSKTEFEVILQLGGNVRP